jgi:hypothetical protein
MCGVVEAKYRRVLLRPVLSDAGQPDLGEQRKARPVRLRIGQGVARQDRLRQPIAAALDRHAAQRRSQAEPGTALLHDVGTILVEKPQRPDPPLDAFEIELMLVPQP